DKGSNLSLDRGGYTPLHASAASGKLEITKILIQSGLSINKQDQNGTGYTPLHWATQEGYLRAALFDRIP
ncbi:ankyrin repeat domain-containing protein, partial [Bacillus sp. mrc49]|uniref:ankyrin repeat domain-containing protein n=1 Tax=Bacillus sp. mrc49 TaxID=2054913 RepID=UPI000CBCCBC7